MQTPPRDVPRRIATEKSELKQIIFRHSDLWFLIVFIRKIFLSAEQANEEISSFSGAPVFLTYLIFTNIQIITMRLTNNQPLSSESLVPIFLPS
jgi:hypothetical protein